MQSAKFYKVMWDERGYGKRWARVMSTRADLSRKQVALMRVWHRMVAALTSGGVL